MVAKGKSILIYSPFAVGTAQGNAISASRLESMINDFGYVPRVEANEYSGAQASLAIILNAWRSAEVIQHFKKVNPTSAVIILITGSDINHKDFGSADSVVRKAMDAADALVMLHDIEFDTLPFYLQKKCTVIYPSVDLPKSLSHQPNQQYFEVILSGNIRAVKNPELAVKIAQLLPENAGIKIRAYGNVESEYREMLQKANDTLPSFHWAGQVSHMQNLEKLQSAHLLLNTSHAEGGANAICEALSIGIPVIASDIRGNIGMLGKFYAGLFTKNNAEMAVELLIKARQNPHFYTYLKQQTKERATKFSFDSEYSEWEKIINYFLGV